VVVVPVLALLSYSGLAEMVRIAPDRMAVVDGRRAFVLGLYENPADDTLLKQVAEAGFNLVRASADAAALDRLARHGLHGWINTGSCIDLSDDRANREKQMRGLVGSFAKHPALLAWEVPDEILWNCWYEAVKWRTEDEPAQQRTRIDALTDKALADAVRTQRVEAERLFQRGDFAASERIADAIWGKLGLKSPSPGLNVSEAGRRAEKTGAGLLDGYALLKQLDPDHPVWMNHAPRNQPAQLAAFNAAADAVGCDIYPVPEYQTGHSDLAERSLAATGAYTRRIQDAAPGKPVWMVLQGFGWADLQKDATEETRKKNPRPTFDQSRFMAYDTIVRGARGILYWGTEFIEKDSVLWKDLLRLVRELADLQPVLSAPDAPLPVTIEIAPTWGSLDRRVEALAKTIDRKTWFLVVNECTEPLHYTLQGLNTLEGTSYRDARDDRKATVTNGKLNLDIQGHGVQVLEPGSGGQG
jgi:hypothetical protein